MTCSKCGSKRITKKGKQANGRQRYICNDCGSRKHPIDAQTNSFEFSGNGDDAVYSTKTETRIKTLDDLIRVCEIDLSEWVIDRWVCNKWEVGAKAGKDGPLQVSPLFQVKVWLKKNRVQLRMDAMRQDMIDDLKKYAYKYDPIKYMNDDARYLMEIDMPDLHLGKLTWAEESGNNYDIKIAQQLAIRSITTLINRAVAYNIDKILFPIGNDFFNVNSKNNITAHNTPQQEDVRWQKSFRIGRQLMVRIIDMLQEIAPVDVLIITGNHDEERSFYLGDALECWYHDNDNVSINNKAMKRKYYHYGENLIGFTHGYHEKLNDLPMIMAHEQRELWGTTTFKEWQTGDKHHKKEYIHRLKEDELKGVTVRILRSLSGTDAWHFDKGFIGNNRGTEAYIRHKELGLISQINSLV